MEYLYKIKNYISNHVTEVICISISTICIVGSTTYIFFNKCAPCVECTQIDDSVSYIKDEKTDIENMVTYKIDIKGAVKSPGVYEVNMGDNIYDVINKAGGLTKSATTINLNLAMKVRDEMVIYVFTKNELNSQKTVSNCDNNLSKESEINIGSKEIYINPTIENPVSDSTNIDNEEENNNDVILINKISINTNSLEELMSLDGIGESKAKTIIEYRKNNGNFKTIEEIMNVSGIGEKAYEKIKDKITI